MCQATPTVPDPALFPAVFQLNVDSIKEIKWPDLLTPGTHALCAGLTPSYEITCVDPNGVSLYVSKTNVVTTSG